MCEPETATENVWHVLDVIEGSPAESAGLVPMGDWILGMCELKYNAPGSVLKIFRARLVGRRPELGKRFL
jgi:hypothetical protein